MAAGPGPPPGPLAAPWSLLSVGPAMAHVCTALAARAAADPAAPATVCGERARDAGALAARAAGLAGVLADAGVRPGDRVAILARGSDHALEAALAVRFTSST